MTIKFVLICAVISFVYGQDYFDIDYESYPDYDNNLLTDSDNYESIDNNKNICCGAIMPWQHIPYHQSHIYKYAMPHWPHVRHAYHHSNFRPPLHYNFYNPCLNVQTPCYNVGLYRCCRDYCNRSLCYISYTYLVVVEDDVEGDVDSGSGSGAEPELETKALTKDREHRVKPDLRRRRRQDDGDTFLDDEE